MLSTKKQFEVVNGRLDSLESKVSALEIRVSDIEDGGSSSKKKSSAKAPSTGAKHSKGHRNWYHLTSEVNGYKPGYYELKSSSSYKYDEKAYHKAGGRKNLTNEGKAKVYAKLSYLAKSSRRASI